MSDTVARLKLDDSIVMQFGNKLYSQPTWWVLIRELVQNAIDAKAKNITIKTTDSSIHFKDDGTGMTKDDLLNIFLTVGGSNKDRDNQTVGGFGIAKLAIFACEEFEVISGRYSLTKDILINHQKLREYDQAISGTSVFVEKSGLVGYGTLENLKWYLSLIDREINISLNGETVQKAEKRSVAISGLGNVPVFECSIYSSANVIVRANGLPLFYGSVGNDRNKHTYPYDLIVTADPYDPEYPFTITRDSFTPITPASREFEAYRNKINAHFKSIQDAEEALQEAISYDKKYDVWVKNKPDLEDLSLKAFETFKKTINLLLMITGQAESTNVGFGIIGDAKKNKEEAGAYAYVQDADKHVFFLGEGVTDKDMTIAIAIHEFSHMGHEDHYAGFAYNMTEMVYKYLSSFTLFEGLR